MVVKLLGFSIMWMRLIVEKTRKKSGLLLTRRDCSLFHLMLSSKIFQFYSNCCSFHVQFFTCSLNLKNFLKFYRRHGKIKCTIAYFERVNDNKLKFYHQIPITSGNPLMKDYAVVECLGDNQQMWFVYIDKVLSET